MEVYKTQYDRESNPELTADIDRLQNLLHVAMLFYESLKEKHGDIWPDYIDSKLPIVQSYVASPIEVWPEEEDF
jgi:hypothetical protein